MTFITTEYEAEAIAGRRRAILTIRKGDGATTVLPVTLISYDWGRGSTGTARVVFESDGASMMHYRYTGGDKEA